MKKPTVKKTTPKLKPKPKKAPVAKKSTPKKTTKPKTSGSKKFDSAIDKLLKKPKQ